MESLKPSGLPTVYTNIPFGGTSSDNFTGIPCQANYCATKPGHSQGGCQETQDFTSIFLVEDDSPTLGPTDNVKESDDRSVIIENKSTAKATFTSPMSTSIRPTDCSTIAAH